MSKFLNDFAEFIEKNEGRVFSIAAVEESNPDYLTAIMPL
jgi:hypothetical protein